MWFKRYGMKANPFVIEFRPNAFVGFDDVVKRVVEAIESNDIILVSGPFGSGKTALLLWLRGFLEYADYKPIYLDGADFYLTSDVRELYEEINSYIKGSFWENLKNVLTKKKKKVVFLIDEADSIPKNLGEIIKADKDRGFIYSVVFASTKDNLSNISPSLTHRIVEKIFLRPMSFEEALEMVEKRIESVGGKNPFHPGALKYICRISKWLPRDILKNCERVMKELAYRKRKLDVITKKDVVSVLGKGRRKRSKRKKS